MEWVVLSTTVSVSVLLPIVVTAANGGGTSSTIQNPVACNDLRACLEKVVEYVLSLAGVLALAGVIYGGFIYLTSAGSQERIETGKNAVVYSVIGVIVIGLAFAIVQFIFNALGGGGTGGSVTTTPS